MVVFVAFLAHFNEFVLLWSYVLLYVLLRRSVLLYVLLRAYVHLYVLLSFSHVERQASDLRAGRPVLVAHRITLTLAFTVRSFRISLELCRIEIIRRAG